MISFQLQTSTERVLLSPLDLKKKPNQKPVVTAAPKKAVLTKQMFQEKMLTLLEVRKLSTLSLSLFFFFFFISVLDSQCFVVGVWVVLCADRCHLSGHALQAVPGLASSTIFLIQQNKQQMDNNNEPSCFSSLLFSSLFSFMTEPPQVGSSFGVVVGESFSGGSSFLFPTSAILPLFFLPSSHPPSISFFLSESDFPSSSLFPPFPPSFAATSTIEGARKKERTKEKHAIRQTQEETSNRDDAGLNVTRRPLSSR